MPVTAHVALDKGAHWMDIEVRKTPLTGRYVADVAAMAAQIDDQTIALAASAGDYAHGLIDPIAEIGALAQSHGIGLHVDGCLGGWLLPWVERLGYDVPLWDFRVPGVTSISADTHKYGYALKGSSVLLYRDKERASSSTSPTPTGRAASTCRRASPARAAAASWPRRGRRCSSPASRATWPRPTPSCARRPPSATASSRSPSSR